MAKRQVKQFYNKVKRKQKRRRRKREDRRFWRAIEWGSPAYEGRGQGSAARRYIRRMFRMFD